MVVFREDDSHNLAQIISAKVPQEDEVGKIATIGVMDQIYASAMLTIIAASGVDANAGLAGVRSNSRSIHSLPGTIYGIGLLRYEPAPVHFGPLPWSRRGWTYQEGHFSSNKLIFAHDRVFYECESGSYGEAWSSNPLECRLIDCISSERYDHVKDRDQRLFSEIKDHITGYTSGELTFKSDILNAFAGISDHYLKQHECPFL
jgi:hypothetical protein